jgi:hypothetical protein
LPSWKLVSKLKYTLIEADLMSNQQSKRRKQPLYVWLPSLALKLLVFLALAFVLYQAAVGLKEHDLSSGRVTVIVVGMAGLLLLVVADRLVTLKFTPAGVEATLSEAKTQALEEVAALEDRQAAEAARAKILEAENPNQVKAAMATAVELNVTRVVKRIEEALRQKRKCYLRYRPGRKSSVAAYLAAPLDIKPGKTQATRVNDYVWVHSYEHERVISLRLGRVLGVELSEESFDPAELMADWKNKEPEWNVPREW